MGKGHWNAQKPSLRSKHWDKFQSLKNQESNCGFLANRLTVQSAHEDNINNVLILDLVSATSLSQRLKLCQSLLSHLGDVLPPVGLTTGSSVSAKILVTWACHIHCSPWHPNTNSLHTAFLSDDLIAHNIFSEFSPCHLVSCSVSNDDTNGILRNVNVWFWSHI